MIVYLVKALKISLGWSFYVQEHLFFEDLSIFLDQSTFSTFQVELQFLESLEIGNGDEMIIMESKSQPIFCLSCIFFIFMITKTIFSIEIWKYTFQEKQKTFRIRKLFLNLFIINPFFLKINDNGTSASVGFITKICKLHESLLTASQFPYLLNTIEYIVANSLPLRTYCNRLPFLVSNILICIPFYEVVANFYPF